MRRSPISLSHTSVSSSPRPSSPGRVPRILVGVLGALAAVNVVGVANGARLSNVVTVAKLLPLVAFCVVGLWLTGARLPGPEVQATTADWTQAVLLLIFAFGGFEAALMPMAEAKNPRHDIPVALGVALVTCTLLYTALHVVVLAVPGAAATARPIAEAARSLVGPPGAVFMAGGATLSIIGILSAGMINTPRLLYSMAAGGDLPRVFADVHPRFRTPWVVHPGLRGGDVRLRAGRHASCGTRCCRPWGACSPTARCAWPCCACAQPDPPPTRSACRQGRCSLPAVCCSAWRWSSQMRQAEVAVVVVHRRAGAGALAMGDRDRKAGGQETGAGGSDS